jgi:hypothetical protein
MIAVLPTRRDFLSSLAGASLFPVLRRVAAATAPDPVTIRGRVDASRRILIPIRINGSGPLWSILDSAGGGAVYLDQETAAKASLTGSWAGTSSGPNNREPVRDSRTRALVSADTVNLGVALVVIKPVATTPTVSMSLLLRYVVELDYEVPSVRLYDADAFRYTGGRAAPFSLEPDFANNPFTRAVLTVAGAEIPAYLTIDTGCGGCSASLSRSFIDRHVELRSLPAANGYAAIEQLCVGHEMARNPVLRLAASRGYGGNPEPDGLLGVEFLRHYRVFMDYRRLEMILRPEAAFAAAAGYA